MRSAGRAVAVDRKPVTLSTAPCRPARSRAGGGRGRCRSAGRRCARAARIGAKPAKGRAPRRVTKPRRRRAVVGRVRLHRASKPAGTPMIRSHRPAPMVLRTKPRRSAAARRIPAAHAQVVCARRAMRFSKPASSRCEYGRLSGSAHTRSAALAPRRPPAARRRPAPARQQRTSSAAFRAARRHTASLPSRVLRQVLHRVGEAVGGGAVARVEVAGHDGAGPAADARQDGDVLLAVRAAVG
jgi:hypothetical protein